MLEVIEFIVTKFTSDVIVISVAVSAVLAVVIIAFWLYNRRRFHKLGHQIPASVVKNYLDSIIQNSTALKSSLFRGGGLDVGQGVPSVVPVNEIATGSVAAGGASHEELNQKIAEISSLQMRLNEKERVIADLEKKASDLERQLSGSAGGDEIVKLQKEIDDLKEKLRLAEQNSGGGGGGNTAELERQLDEVIKERDQLKERLMEYEIIEEDLANLKRLQQENEQLKKSLAALQGGEAPPAEEGPAPAEEEPAPAEEEPAPAEEEPAPAEEEPAPAEEEPAPAEEEAVPENAGEQKSAEELLGEFEKMLG